MRPAAGGSTCAGARSAGTSAAATPPRPSTPARTRSEAGHPVIQSYEPGEAWFWSYPDEQLYERGPELAPPDHHPRDQTTPGPEDRVPADWQSHLNY